LLEPVKDRLSQTPFEKLMTFPVFHRGEFFGLMSLGLTQKGETELPYLQKFGQVCAQIISLSLGLC